MIRLCGGAPVSDPVSGPPPAVNVPDATANPQDGQAGPAGELRCAYPGCPRPPAEARQGVGRRPRYCGQVVGGTEHNRQNARNARLALQAAGTPSDDVAAGEPVTMARAQASLLIERLEQALTGQAQLLTRTLEQLHVMGDPAAVQAELASVTTTARAEAEQARAQAAAAEQARIAAEAARAAAEADRADADDAAAEAEQTATQAREEAEQARSEAEAAQTQVRESAAELTQVRAHVEQVAQDLAAALQRATAAEQDAAAQRTQIGRAHV